MGTITKSNAKNWVFEIISKSKYQIFLLTFLNIIKSILATTYPIILLQMFYAIEGKDTNLFNKRLVYFCAFIVIQLILTAVLSRYAEIVRVKITLALKNKFLSEYMEKNNISVNNTHSGEVLNRFTTDIDIVTHGAVSIIPNIFSLSIRIILTMIYLYMLLSYIANLLVIGGAVLFVFSLFIRNITKTLHKKTLESEGKVRSFVQEVFQQLPIIRSYSTEDYVLEKNNRLLEDYKKKTLKRNMSAIIIEFVNNSFFNFAVIIGTIFASYEIVNGRLSFAEYFAIGQLIMQARTPLSTLVGYIPQYYRVLASADRLSELIEINETNLLEINFEAPKEINFKDISFEYEDKKTKIIENFNFIVKNGVHLGIVGESGSGKSSFLKILIGVFNANKGNISLKYDDREVFIDKENIKSYRKLFAYVPQTNSFLSDTIKESITFGSDYYDENEIYRALEIACALKFVQELPDGINTEIKESLGLSVGQIQRIAIARAIYSKRPFLVLDESTSALDKPTERELLDNLKKLDNVTLILVTHRLEMLDLCAEIVNFNNLGV